MSFEFTEYDKLKLMLSLWNDNEFEYFQPRDKKTGDIVLFPKQIEAWESYKDLSIKSLAYGGAPGGAKTHTFATAMIFQHLAIPGLHSAVGRHELKDLQNTTLISFYDVIANYGIPEKELKYNGVKNYWEFANGSRIFFLALAQKPSDPDYEWLGSYMLSYFWFEEAQQISYKAYEKACQRVGRQIRLYDKIGYVIDKILITMNVKKNWVYNKFYLPWKEGTLPAKMKFIKALARDNPTLPQEYHDRLDAIADPIERAKQRDGEWEYDDTKNAIFAYSAITKMFEDNPSEQFPGNYITCDPARKGKDECIIMAWEGFRVIEIHIAKKCRTTDIEDRIGQIQIRNRVPNENVIIDSNGVGGGITDHIEGSFEYIGHSRPIVDYNSNERASVSNPSVFDTLRDQVFWVASDFAIKGIPVFSNSLVIERFGEYTDLYTREDIKREFRKEIEQVRKETEDSDKKIKLTKKHEIAEVIARSPNLSDCWSMRFVTDSDINNLRSNDIGIGIVPFENNEENDYYKRLQAI